MKEQISAIVQPLIRAFFRGLTDEQWGALEHAKPDDSLQLLMAELIADIVIAVTKAFQVRLESPGEGTSSDKPDIPSEEDIELDIGNTISQSFKDVLDVDDQLDSSSSLTLESLIKKDVAVSIKSANSLDEELKQHTHVTPPVRLGKMIKNALDMASRLVQKMKIKSRPRRGKKSSSADHEENLLGHEEDRDEQLEQLEQRRSSSVMKSSTSLKRSSPTAWDESTASDESTSVKRSSPTASHESTSVKRSSPTASDESTSVKRSSPTASKGSSTSSSKTSSDSSATSVKEEIETKIKDFINPLYEDFSGTQSLEMQSQSEIEMVATEIATDLQSLENLLEGSQSSEEEETKAFMQRSKEKVKTACTKLFAKAWISRMMAQLRRKFHWGSFSNNSNEPEVSDIPEIVGQLVDQDDDQRPETGIELSVRPWCEAIPRRQNLVLIRELSDYIYRHLTPMRPTSPTTHIRPARDSSVYSEVQDRVRALLAIMGWLLRTRHSPINNITLAIMGRELPEVTEDDEELPHVPFILPLSPAQEKRKLMVEVFMEALVGEIIQKINQQIVTNRDLYAIRMAEKTWAQVKDIDFDVSFKKFKQLEKVLLKKLYKYWGDPLTVLLDMLSGNEALDDYIVSLFRAQVTPKTSCCTSRFCSSVWKAITRCCRGNRVGV